jgi:hypothetical protein
MNITAKQKKERVAGLKNEVNDFHPLLQDLLPHLSRVKRVEYTHGQFEKGADFILFRDDDVLGTTEFDGLIVKTGKIVSDLSAIREQIRECSLKRYIAGGRQNIHLDEIWVVTTENISNGAKVKIHDEFASTKIKFVQGLDIVKWIDDYLPKFWAVKSLPIARYLGDVVNSVQRDSKASSLLPDAGSINVNLGFSPIETKYETKARKVPSKSIPELILKHEVVYIEGEAGAGKTHSIRNAIVKICSSDFYEEHHLVPYFITYSDFFQLHDLDIKKLMDTDEFCAVKECVEDGSKIVVFIDGVDELTLNGRQIRDELTKLFDQFGNVADIRLVLSSRPLNLGNYDEILPKQSIAVEIDKMDVRQMLKMLKSVCQSAKISERLWGDLQDSDLFKQLPRNPISTLLLAQLINDNQQDLPSNLTDVYSRYIEIMLGGWDVEKGLQSRKEYEYTISILGQVSEYFIDNDITHIGKEEALGFFADYLGKRNTTVIPEELFGKCTSRSGIALIDHSGRFCFKHRSFAEFLYALKRFNAHDRGFVDDRVFSLPWRTIYFFYTGLHKDCAELLERMMSIQPKSANERFWRFVNMAEYLLAGYNTEYDVVERSLPILFREIKDLYMDIVQHREESPLTDLPELLVLHFFQAVSSSCYSYRYFIKALEHCALEIAADSEMSKEDQAYTIFFISTVYRALKLPNPFDGLLDDFSKDLPLQVRFGVLYNTKQVKDHSTLLKRNEKLVKHEMKKNPKLRAYAKRLHELPIGKTSEK